jgi:hypothetical protein
MGKSILVCLSVFILIFSCRPKDVQNPQNPQSDNEKVTHVYLYLEDTSVTPHAIKTFVWSQMDSTEDPSISYDTLEMGKNYLGSVMMLDQTKTPFDTLSHEFEEEALKLEHQFFYDCSPTSLLTFTYSNSDKDANGVPVGITPNVFANALGTGSMHVVLKHQPGVKPNSGNGNSTLGSTDLDIVFPVKVK